jgi:hypothetical protein
MDGNYDNAYERRSNFRSLVMLLSQPGSDMLCDSNRLITKYSGLVLGCAVQQLQSPRSALSTRPTVL